MKKFFLDHKITLAGIVLGLVAGLLYWNFIGCANGTCAIWSRWYNSTLYGGLMGFFIGNLIEDFVKPKKQSNP